MPDPFSATTNDESLSLDHMRAFIAVVETGSQVRAAKRLGSTQTTISRHIERVQAYFGGALFEAGASGPLSNRGQIAEATVRETMGQLVQTRARLANERPVFRIGFIRPMRLLVAKALRSLATGHGAPGFEVCLFEMKSDAQARALTLRELDLAVSYDIASLDKANVEKSAVTQDPFALVIPEHAWKSQRVDMATLEKLTYAHTPRSISVALFDAEARWRERKKLEPKRRVACALGSEILAYACSGHGYGFLPMLWSMDRHDGAAFVPCPELGFNVDISVYFQHHVGEATKDLRKCLSAEVRAAQAKLKRQR